jgi:hypothetical protein
MERIKLNKNLYSERLVNEALHAFSDYASLSMEQDQTHWIVQSDDNEALLELCNYLIGAMQ